MKAMVCEMCNSNDIQKQDGLYVCQACGTRYSVEEAKKLMIEGTVDVSGSTVKVDNTASIKNFREKITDFVKNIEEKISASNFSKKELMLACGISLVVIVIAIAFTIFYPSKFERVKRECIKTAGIFVNDYGDSFMIDTLPDEQEKALHAIIYANEKFGFDDSVYFEMRRTSAAMGKESEENDKYIVSWTYHPDDGLEVTYEKNRQKNTEE